VEHSAYSLVSQCAGTLVGRANLGSMYMNV
jgi:hypothetical protein